jgi:hypothetical protein
MANQMQRHLDLSFVGLFADEYRFPRDTCRETDHVVVGNTIRELGVFTQLAVSVVLTAGSSDGGSFGEFGISCRQGRAGGHETGCDDGENWLHFVGLYRAIVDEKW